MSAKDEKPEPAEKKAKKEEGEKKIEKKLPDLPLFKIAKADPKNSFDFEDVADK